MLIVDVFWERGGAIQIHSIISSVPKTHKEPHTDQREFEIAILKGIADHPKVHCSTVHSSQDMEATKMSIAKGMDKEDVVHIHSGILLSHKKE